MDKFELYSYWRSSAAYRVRIALNLKQIEYEQKAVNLLTEQGHPIHFHLLNPNGLVPVLVHGDVVLNQSLAIMLYLDEHFPQPSLLPKGDDRYQVIAMAQDIISDIHPLNNLRVLRYLTNPIGATQEQKGAWYHHWIHAGFEALENRLVACAGHYAFGDSVTILDVCLVPQVYNAERFDVDMERYPIIQRITEKLRLHPAFVRALPENQPDAS
ncbi:maleylacetoacetate isomerase [Vibrio tritonius]|uniref:Maleylacetoacetate isomerase n=1 Tax=Vibrio tritonius TaxID=1435069 RepID=A0ABS7YTM9_9VIBR|nr:maleylacetoacetate isomerase [Vibrio tritonius]MCA2018417.1 maleylacetoacetate isomerase [Vibrio tritonius]